MDKERLQEALHVIDLENAKDPHQEIWQGQSYPKTLLYSIRMTETLTRFLQHPSDLLHIAARGQHIRRWEIPRDSYPATREGYLQWRSILYRFHAEQVAQVMAKVGYHSTDVERVVAMLQKRHLKTNPDGQHIEDVACLVFLQYYLLDFSTKQHPDKIGNILHKTWQKMSEHAREEAKKMSLPEPVLSCLAGIL